MIKHIVMWRFKEYAQGNTKSENMRLFREGLEALTAIIPELKTLEIGTDELKSESSYDMIMISTFDSFEALDTYKNHPEHKKVSAFCKEIRENRTAVDFTL